MALESYFEKRAQETWERNLRKTTLLNMYNPRLMETILKALREQLKESDQLNAVEEIALREQFREDDQMNTAGETAGSIPETSLECDERNKEKSFGSSNTTASAEHTSRKKGETQSHLTSHIWQLGCANRICGESGSFRRGKHSAALFHNPNQDVRVAMHGNNFECFLDDDGLKHTDTLITSKDAAKRQGITPGFKDSNLNNVVTLKCDH